MRPDRAAVTIAGAVSQGPALGSPVPLESLSTGPRLLGAGRPAVLLGAKRKGCCDLTSNCLLRDARLLTSRAYTLALLSRDLSAF